MLFHDEGAKGQLERVIMCHFGKRIDFVLNMVTSLVEQGCVGMSDDEKRDFVAKVVEKVKI